MQESKAQRWTGLDGLRGLAAIVVVLGHSNNAVQMPMDVRLSLLEGPLGIALNSQGAVQIFFVLSGFVLANSLSRGIGFARMAVSGPRARPRGIVVEQLQFYLKRIFRIFPPYIVAVVFAFAASRGYVMVAADHGLTRWITDSAAVHLSTAELLSTFAFPGSALGLVPQGWTLRVEMIFSFLMPLMFLIAHRLHWSVLILLSLSAFSLTSPLGDLRYAIDFAIGIAIHFENDRIGRWVKRLPGLLTPALVVAGLALFAAPMLLGWFRANEYLGLWMHGFDADSILIMAVGSGILVIAAIHVAWFRDALSLRPILFLGRISYSLYLLHRVFIALFATNLAATGAAPWLFGAGGLGLMALVLAAAIPVSALAYYAIERPAIRLGNRACKAVARRFESESLTTST